jgi:hypothetical protein
MAEKTLFNNRLMRAAIRRNRVIAYPRLRELELHIMAIVNYCRIPVDKMKFRAVARGVIRRVNYVEYVGTIRSPDLVWF